MKKFHYLTMFYYNRIMDKKERAFFLLPGFKMKADSKAFDWLDEYLDKNNFEVFRVPLEWNYRTLSDCANDFIQFYLSRKLEENYVLGFSYGAVITMITANNLGPNRIYLCSLSPDFEEDLPFMEG